MENKDKYTPEAIKKMAKQASEAISTLKAEGKQRSEEIAKLQDQLKIANDKLATEYAVRDVVLDCVERGTLPLDGVKKLAKDLSDECEGDVNKVPRMKALIDKVASYKAGSTEDEYGRPLENQSKIEKKASGRYNEVDTEYLNALNG